MAKTTLRVGLGAIALFLASCGAPKKECAINTECNPGFICNAGKCEAGGFGGGAGLLGGGTGATGGGSVTGGGGGTTGGGDGTTGGGVGTGGGDGTTGGGTGTGGGDGTTGGGTGTGGGDGTTGGGVGTGGGDGTVGGGVGTTGGGVGVTGGGVGTGGGDGTTGGGVGLTGGGVGTTGGGVGTTGGGDGTVGGGVGTTGGGVGTTGGGVGTTGGGVGTTGGGVGTTGGGVGTTGGGVGTTGGGVGTTGGGVGTTGGGVGTTGGGVGTTGGGAGTTGGGGGAPIACTPRGILAPNATVIGSLARSSTRTSPEPSCGTFDGQFAEEIWQFTVNATSNVVLETFAGVDGGALDTVVNVRNVCSEATDIACDDEGGAGSLSRVIRTMQPGTYVALVQEYDTSSIPAKGGTYGLSFATFPIVSNSVCTANIPLSPGSPITGQNTSGGGAASSACGLNAGGQLFYSISVPHDYVLTASATPTGSARRAHYVRVLDSCAATSCLSNGTGTATTAATTSWRNTTGVTANVIISVSPLVPGDWSPFELVASTTPYVAPQGDTCQAPQIISMSGTLTGQTTVGYANEISTALSCTGYGNSGPDRVYAVTVPAGLELTATIPSPSWDPALYVVGQPASNCQASGTTCLVGSDIVNATETLRWMNTGATDAVVYLVVDGWDATESGPYSLTIAFGTPTPPPYIVTTVANGCLSIDAGTPLAFFRADGGVDNDDGNTAVQSIGFPFNFFGAPVTHFSVNTNGFAQLWDTATPSLSYSGTISNQPIPTASTPNALVAPFWDDLIVRPSGSGVRTSVVGNSPARRLVIEWADMSGYTFDTPTQTLRFQAQIIEQSNAIEFHYCQLENADGGTTGRVFGSEASIGLEDSAGARGVQRSFNQANSVSTSTGFRFTP